MVERAVAGDAVKPRPHVDLALVGEDRVEGGREDLLQHILGVLARAQHVPHERQQAGLIARAQRLERGVLAATRQRDEPLIGLQPEQGRGAPQAGGGARMCECGDLHGQSKAALSLIDTVTAGKLRSGYSRQVGALESARIAGPG